jgi:hypothetical protein
MSESTVTVSMLEAAGLPHPLAGHGAVRPRSTRVGHARTHGGMTGVPE